jgi:hypothetical protein
MAFVALREESGCRVDVGVLERAQVEQLVPLRVMVPRFCVASTKHESALVRSQG